MLEPSHSNQIGLGCGCPSGLTVISQAMGSSRRRRAARSPNGVVVSIEIGIRGMLPACG